MIELCFQLRYNFQNVTAKAQMCYKITEKRLETVITDWALPFWVDHRAAQ